MVLLTAGTVAAGFPGFAGAVIFPQDVNVGDVCVTEGCRVVVTCEELFHYKQACMKGIINFADQEELIGLFKLNADAEGRYLEWDPVTGDLVSTEEFCRYVGVQDCLPRAGRSDSVKCWKEATR